MKNITNILILIFFIFLSVYIFLPPKELFTKFNILKNTQFAGLNLLGTSSNDGSIPAANFDICKNYCNINNHCKGFTYYQPGNQCFLFMSGNFIPNRPDYISGKKI